MLALALAAALTAFPDAPDGDLDPGEADTSPPAVLRADALLRRAAPCEERTGWLGDDDPREPGACDDEDGAWLVAPRRLAEERDDADAPR